MGAGVVGADLAGVAPGVDGEEFIRDGGGEVHGAAVDTHDKGGMAEEPEEFGQAGAVEEVGDVGWEVGEFFAAASDEDNGAIKGAAKGGDGFGGKGFVAAAGEWVEDDERFGGKGIGRVIALRQIEDGWPGEGGSGRGGKSEVAFDGVGLRIDGHGAGLGEAGAFAGVGESVEGDVAEGAGHEGGAEEALEIEDEVGRGLFFQGAAPAREAQPAGGTTEIGAGKKERFVEVWIAFEERRPLGIDHPGEVRVWEFGVEGGERGEGVDDVAEGAGLEDEETARGRRRGHLPRARRSASSVGRPASRILRWVVSMS